MGWRDCVSPEQEAEIDGLSLLGQHERNRVFDEWATEYRAKKTKLFFQEWKAERETSLNETNKA